LLGTGMRIRLTRRLAEKLNGVDLSHRRVGDLMELSTHDAEVLIAAKWGVAVESAAITPQRAEAACQPPHRKPRHRT